MKKQPCTPKLGADIEVFLFDGITGTIAPCVGVIDGTKEKPFVPKGFGKGYALQEDNVMLEYNIPPVDSSEALSYSMGVAKKMIERNLPEEHSYRIYSEHEFMPDQLTSPQAQTIGCEPDFNAYEGGEIRAFNGVLSNVRSCGGHIHLGGNFNCPDFVAALFADLFLGILAGTRPRRVNSRTEWYGRPGIFRPKPYGIEYRTPSNQWTRSDENIESVGFYGINLADWLTKTEAAQLRTTFKNITWTRIRDFLIPDHKVHQDQNVRSTIIKEARNAGAPI